MVLAGPAGSAGPAARPVDRSLPRAWGVAALVTAAAVYGLAVPDAYRDVPGLTRATWRAQDAVCLATLPVLLLAAARARAGSLRAHVGAVGVLTWLAYCYAHLAVAVPFNPMFLVYVATVLLAGFGMLDGLLRLDVARCASAFEAAPRRAAAWFLLVAGLGVAGLWLSDIVPGFVGDLPANLHLAELPNPTWVLDLAWIVPVALAAGRLLLVGHPAGVPVAGSLLAMLLILSVAMLAVTPFALAAGLGDDPSVRLQLVVFTVVFAVLGAIEAILLAAGRRVTPPPAGWLRAGWWPQP